MQYIELGETGLEVSRLGFGCIKFDQLDQATVTEALNGAIDLGINFFDTARAYGPSEEMIGEAIASRREEYFLATKTGERDGADAAAQIEESLQNLRTDYIDLYQLHNVATPEEWEAAMGSGGALEALLEAKREGKIGHIGITIHRSLENMRKALEMPELETLMVLYNPLDEENVGEELLPLAGDSETGIIVMKALSGGRLTSREEGRTEIEEGERDPVVEGCLRFVLANSNVDVVIPGMRTAAEVEENVATEGMKPLSEEEEERLLTEIGRLDRSYKYDQECLQCGYCQPCPQGVEIPKIFRSVYVWEQYPDSVRNEVLRLASSVEVGPEGCIECEECLGECPAGIDIPARLKEVADDFRQIREKAKRS